jgi:hypothetical protein
MDQLSPHFTLGELTASQTAARNGLPNEPDAAALANLKRLVNTLEHVRAVAGKPIVISSGYRSPEVNHLVGGVANSAHTTGCAADIICPGMPNRKLAQLIVDEIVVFDQLILEFPESSTGGWVHIAIAEQGKKPRDQVLTTKPGGGYLNGLR